ncbi:MAG: hypothetical protein HN742_35800 [Lentisphaerae bacterium]|jgi:hypothetical protein|nr:hypothetical protein [Lentisphaerota bacterium]MBT4816352.1 hypothetical protein [Lentisphaerota bacterium]MBT5612418.1 hypothetical protein [Lentisphaerota bacterium]MBT7057124.1 hypothetical protein [Lentisphaerota bacterium]MBT7847290.1 hypothetical protein [Lentisphaerota bacterium]
MFCRKIGWVVGLGLAFACTRVGAEDSLPPLKDGKAPTTVEEAWAGFDPRREPLDVEVLKKWEEDGVVVEIIRLRVGIFKGTKAMLAAVYGYPKGAESLPGLVQIHGGGQSAQSSFVVKDAKNGYATISIAWAGRIIATNYTVTNKEKEVFWAGKADDPDYRVTTDWGAVDGYHHPSRFAGRHFVQTNPSDCTNDAVNSARNSGWFLGTMGARRAITFLEQQPQVDKDRIGVYGMSMGAKLTVLTAGSDSRVKAASPACGGLSDLSVKGRTLPPIADDEYLKRITCPTIIMSPSNDFHSNVQDIPQAVKDIKSRDWRVVSSPNRNHGDSSEYSVGALLWFNQFLKREFTMAKTPTTRLTLKTADNVPSVSVTSDQSQMIQSVNVYYTQGGERKPAEKYWRVARPVDKEGKLTFQLPLVSVDKPLWAYADVQYALGRTVEGVGYSGEAVKTDSYHLASVVEMLTPQDLENAGVVATIDESVLREDSDTYQPGSDLKTAFPAFSFSEGISCIADPGPRQGMSIKMKDSPDFEYAWLPLLTLNTAIAPFIGTDKWTCSADIMLDAKEPVPVTVEFRARDHKKKFTPIIVDDTGAISARGKTTTQLCTVAAGTWWTFSVTYDLNHSENYQVTIKNAEGAVLAEESMEIQGDVGGVNWVGFIAHGVATGSLYVDNVSLEQVGPSQK